MCRPEEPEATEPPRDTRNGSAMAEPIPTAVELVEQIDFTAGHQAALLLIEAFERAVRLDQERKTLVEAAKAECDSCCLEFELRHDSQRYYHVDRAYDGCRRPCEAPAIRALLAKLEPEVCEDDDTAQQIFAAKVQNLQARLSDISNVLGELHKWRDNTTKLEPEVQT